MSSVPLVPLGQPAPAPAAGAADEKKVPIAAGSAAAGGAPLSEAAARVVSRRQKSEIFWNGYPPEVARNPVDATPTLKTLEAQRAAWPKTRIVYDIAAAAAAATVPVVVATAAAGA